MLSKTELPAAVFMQVVMLTNGVNIDLVDRAGMAFRTQAWICEHSNEHIERFTTRCQGKGGDITTVQPRAIADARQQFEGRLLDGDVTTWCPEYYSRSLQVNLPCQHMWNVSLDNDNC